MKKPLLSIALAALAIGTAAPASATPWPDEPYYLQRLAEKGITNAYGPADSLQTGYAICGWYEAGWGDVAVMNAVEAYNPGLWRDSHSLAAVTTIAQFALCPWTLPEKYRADAIARGTLVYAQ